MFENRVRRAVREGRPAFGTYIRSGSAAAVEIAAQAGLDFVRFDAYHSGYNPETLHTQIRTALMMGVTPWVRVPNDPLTIGNILDMGALAVTVPNIGSRADVEAAIHAVRYPPAGRREHSRPGFARAMSMSEYLDWSERELMISCQIEGEDGLANYKEIVRVDGLDVVQSGRGDLSLALGVPGQKFHPTVLAAEEKIVDAALDAGKAVSLVFSIDDEGMNYIQRWMSRGVLLPVIDSDESILLRGYRQALASALSDTIS